MFTPGTPNPPLQFIKRSNENVKISIIIKKTKKKHANENKAKAN